MSNKEAIIKSEFLLCPICNNKTRTKAFLNTVLINFPLFCPKCKNEPLVNVEKLIITAINSPSK